MDKYGTSNKIKTDLLTFFYLKGGLSEINIKPQDLHAFEIEQNIKLKKVTNRLEKCNPYKVTLNRQILLFNEELKWMPRTNPNTLRDMSYIAFPPKGKRHYLKKSIISNMLKTSKTALNFR